MTNTPVGAAVCIQLELFLGVRSEQSTAPRKSDWVPENRTIHDMHSDAKLRLPACPRGQLTILMYPMQTGSEEQ